MPDSGVSFASRKPNTLPTTSHQYTTLTTSNFCFIFKNHLTFTMSHGREYSGSRYVRAAGSSARAGPSSSRARGVPSPEYDIDNTHVYYASPSEYESHWQRAPSVSPGSCRRGDAVSNDRLASERSRSSSASNASQPRLRSMFRKGNNSTSESGEASEASGSTGSSRAASVAGSRNSFPFIFDCEMSSSSRESSRQRSPQIRESRSYSSHSSDRGSPHRGRPLTENIPSSGVSDQLTPDGYHFREGSDIHNKYTSYKTVSHQASNASQQYKEYANAVPIRKRANQETFARGASGSLSKNYTAQERM